jgi:S-formylglutathione hydrolase FrmB
VTPRRTASVLIAAAATAAVIWAYASHGRPDRPSPVPIQDGKTLDFSNGSPQVADNAADKAALDKGVREIDEATKNITFSAQPTPAK